MCVCTSILINLSVIHNLKSAPLDVFCNGILKTIFRTFLLLSVSIWNKEELPEEWKGSIIVPIHKKGQKTDCNNYRDITLLPTT